MMCSPSHLPERFVYSPSREGDTIRVAGCGGLAHFGL